MYTDITVYLNDSTFFNLYYHTIIIRRLICINNYYIKCFWKSQYVWNHFLFIVAVCWSWSQNGPMGWATEVTEAEKIGGWSHQMKNELLHVLVHVHELWSELLMSGTPVPNVTCSSET